MASASDMVLLLVIFAPFRAGPSSSRDSNHSLKSRAAATYSGGGLCKMLELDAACGAAAQTKKQRGEM
jgi:hypothetical protein